MMFDVSSFLAPGLAQVLRYRKRSKLPWKFLVLIVILAACSGRLVTEERERSNKREDKRHFPDDILTPYSTGRHGSTRTTRDVGDCQQFVWENRTYEEFYISKSWSPKQVEYDVFRFADVVHRTPLRRRYAVGSIAVVKNPFHSFSILEPKQKGGCQMKYYSVQRSTVRETIQQRKNGCRLAANAGYFNVHNGECLGNIVSSGRIVKSVNGIANANFGIRADGSVVVGYVSEEDVRNKANPFRQLVSGVIWLVRNGTNYVNESMKIECSDTEDTGSMKTFVEVLSARSAIGYDEKGRIVMAHVEGQTHVRGVNLYEFADLLIRKGVINAINLDGGGSSTFVQDNLLMNYPSDHCHFDAKYRCPREVSTVVCIHDPECLDPSCSGHGSCVEGVCSCDDPWTGEICNEFNCSLTNCSGNGECSNGKCQCTAGWTGDFCNKSCPANHYGVNCAKSCYCYGKAMCHPVYGNCTCPAGLTGTGCWRECGRGLYGPNCKDKCQYPDCSGHGFCSKVTGVCQCEEGWTGISCNDTIVYPSATLSSTFVNPLLSTAEYGSYISSSVLSTEGVSHSLSSISDKAVGIVSTVSTAELQLVHTTTAHSTPSLLSPSPSFTVNQPCDPVLFSESPSTLLHVYQPTASYQSVVVIVMITSLLTIVVHILLCVCCRGGGLLAGSTRDDMRREMIDKRQWEQLNMSLRTNWNSESSD